MLRAFRPVLREAGLDPATWTPRELRHSFVSLLSSNGVSIEDIAGLCGHSGTTITETVYRHQLRPVLLTGAVAMDGSSATSRSHSVSHPTTRRGHLEPSEMASELCRDGRI